MEVEDREYFTSNDKKIKVYRVKNSGLFCINFADGGSLPKELQGMFTNPKRAQERIEDYLANHKADKRYVKKKEATVNGETAE